MNTSMRNPGTNRFRDPYRLALNPENAETLGLRDGELARVTTSKGSITVPVEITWQTARGYCMVPHHFGLSCQGKGHGMHINYLTDHRDIDDLTGNARELARIFLRTGAEPNPRRTAEAGAMGLPRPEGKYGRLLEKALWKMDAEPEVFEQNGLRCVICRNLG